MKKGRLLDTDDNPIKWHQANTFVKPSGDTFLALISDGSVRTGKMLIMSYDICNHQRFSITGETIDFLHRNVIRLLVTMSEGVKDITSEILELGFFTCYL
ncbi:hypothetical protein DCM90_01335 [Levilactobacillus bambusae]|uniref:Uncharacterized protein n=1 Tax=Levilactobacillus bambusae TaxID=2024736 RepID=A0A2V1N0R8_9LACO|nr:hypothetical protein DCM90_01335 [Levilactobacillus bambusae]